MSAGAGPGPRSMTGFGRGEAPLPGDGRVYAEVRSVNARYLEVTVRLPAPDLELEERVRRAVRGRLARGRVEVAVREEDKPSPARRAVVDTELATAYYKVLKQLAETLHLRSEVSIDTLAQLPGVFSFVEAPPDAEPWRRAALSALEEALDRLAAMREAEGRALAADMAVRLEELGRRVEELAARAPRLVEEVRRRLRERMASLLSEGEVDEGRLALEAGLLAERADVTEEVVRLRSHLSQARSLLAGAVAGESVGRRLDFLFQEMSRELATVSAKAGDPDVARSAVDGRAEVERLREQAQNLE